MAGKGFPSGDMINVGSQASKVKALSGKCDVFVDDSIYNFTELNAAGINCYLMTRPHNAKYDVGFKRVYSISEFLNKVKHI